MITTDNRLESLHIWVEQQLKTQICLQPLGGDAGFRRYFRLNPRSGWLAVDAPPATENTNRFVQMARLLAGAGVRVPRIKAANIEEGFLLVEDFGDQLVYQLIQSQHADRFYQQANQLITQIQQITPPDWLENYDQAFLLREMDLLIEWFIEKLLQYPIHQNEKNWLAGIFLKIVDSALAQPRVVVHRDFHSRNLLVCDDQQLACIDFQGALHGPLTYDCVSLLRDCYLRWPIERVQKWSMDFYQRIQPRYPYISAETFSHWFDWMGLQRHIKVLGIFARLYLRDGKQNYLQDLPLVIRYTLEVCRQYPELTKFAEWFEEKLIPLAKKQAWYHDYLSAGEKV